MPPPNWPTATGPTARRWSTGSTSVPTATDPATTTTWLDGPETLTARLREQTTARRAEGAPLPPTLLAWLDSFEIRDGAAEEA